MSPSYRFRLGFATILSTLCLSYSGQADENANTVPRYRLQVGQDLKYQGSSEFKYENGSHGYKTEWQVWVVRQNDDGSWRIVVRESQKLSMKRVGQEQGGGQAQVTLGYCDLFPDGRITANDSLGYRLDPSVIFPRLPDNLTQAKEGWSAEGFRNDSRTEFKPAANSSPETFVFDGVRHSPMDKIYVSSSRAKYTFDRNRGVTKRIDSETTQGYGFNGKGTGTTELAAIEQHDAEWTKQFNDETSRYFAANKKYEDLQTKASKDAKEVDTLQAQAETTLKETRDQLKLPIVREQVDEQLKNHKGLLSYYKEEAKNRAEVLGHEAAEWETKDLEGKPHSLKDYRGKVVVLDFWYRGCGWCIRAMPQMKQLAEDFKKEPVAIFGMNTDRNEKDAKFVVDAMQLNYPSLKAQGLPEKYHVRGFPTLIIIDQDGKVADIHVGYSPTLHDEVAKVIHELLNKK